MFSVHSTLEKFKNATITGHFGFVFKDSWSGKSYDYPDAMVDGSSVFKMFSVHKKTKLGGFKFIRFKERFLNSPFS